MFRRTLPAAAAAALLLVSSTEARRTTPADSPPVFRANPPAPLSLDRKAEHAFASAAQGTTYLGYWTFDAQGGGCTDEGWTAVDITEQLGGLWHVDDFAGAGPSVNGKLSPLEGNYSLWAAYRPSAAEPFCSYASLPGYNNLANTAVCGPCIEVDTSVTLDLLVCWDAEPGYDGTQVSIDNCDGSWMEITSPNSQSFWAGTGATGYTGMGGPLVDHFDIPNGAHEGSLSFRFRFISDGAWSDQDGLWDTDGTLIDSVTVSDATGVRFFNGFEDGTLGTMSDCTDPGYGDFSGLFAGLNLLQEDPCVSNFSCMWAFIEGSQYNFACGGYPAQTAVPFGNEVGQYLSNEIWSPMLPNVGSGTTYGLEFDVYLDLPLNNLIFFVWHVRSIVAGCAGQWMDTNFVFYDGTNFTGLKQWGVHEQNIGHLIEPGASDLQVALGCVDMCGVWCGQFGDGACHTHAPLFDNVRLYRVETEGPQFTVRDLDLFQDNFSTDGTTTGTARADMALDIRPSYIADIDPGDSVVVTVEDPEAGLAGDPNTGFGPAVYMYVAVWPQGQPGKLGSALTQNAFRWPVVGSIVHDGVTWYGIRADTAFVNGEDREGLSPGKYCVDLNDNLFTPGDTVCYVFCAQSAGPSNAVTYWTPFTGTTAFQSDAFSSPDEFTVLPTPGGASGDILYVDAYNGYGAQPFFDTAFDMLGIRELDDRYDVRGPSSSVNNRLDSRVNDTFQQLLDVYDVIIWNSGDLAITLGDGTGTPSKSNDVGLLTTFLDNLTVPGGLYLSGDHMASSLVAGGFNGTPLLSFITHNLISSNAAGAGYGTNPCVIGSGGCFGHFPFGPDSLVALGGCPSINQFDVLEPTGTATSEMTYGPGNNAGVVDHSNAAVIGQVTNNSAGFNVGALLSGFSFHSIRDKEPVGVPARVHHLYDVLTWLNKTVAIPSEAGDNPKRYALAQNYPNPFNPTTTIAYELRERARVTLRVYNVAGQLVRTLVDDVKSPGLTHEVRWDGRSDAGTAVASGVYFYKLSTKDFTQTKKMVLLK